MKTITSTTEYPSIDYSKEIKSKPFFDLTVEILDCVRDHNFNHLAEICDDDFGIIDINTEGGSEIIRTRQEWEDWFRRLFTKLGNMQARTWSEITRYEAVTKSEMGYSVVDFDQMLVVGEKKMKFSVIATIIWKLDKNKWKESRYHSSLISVEEIN